MSKNLKTIAALAVASSAVIGGHASAASCTVKSGDTFCSTSNIIVKEGRTGSAYGYTESYTTKGVSGTFFIRDWSNGSTIFSQAIACKASIPGAVCRYATATKVFKNNADGPKRYKAGISGYSSPSTDKGFAKAVININ